MEVALRPGWDGPDGYSRSVGHPHAIMVGVFSLPSANSSAPKDFDGDFLAWHCIDRTTVHMHTRRAAECWECMA